MTSVTATTFLDEHLSNHSNNLIIPDQVGLKKEIEKGGQMVKDGVCAICLDDIELQETAIVKGCEHTYCVNCILQWATYHDHPKCPQCKNPFESLGVHRGLDGSLSDYMLEESVCSLVRASWFKPLDVEHPSDFYDDPDDIVYYQYEEPYEDMDEDLDDSFFRNSTSLRIGNRRWGRNGYIRAGRQVARPAHGSNQKVPEAASSSNSSHMGRRAKRRLKREAANKHSS